jgi:hypothetical protein
VIITVEDLAGRRDVTSFEALAITFLDESDNNLGLVGQKRTPTEQFPTESTSSSQVTRCARRASTTSCTKLPAVEAAFIDTPGHCLIHIDRNGARLNKIAAYYKKGTASKVNTC